MTLDEEKLILLISEYPELYDLQNEHYMNCSRKNNIWKIISKKMGIKDIVCKDKWKALRDSYHRNLKRRKGKNGDGPTTSKKWKYESQMEFLRPYLYERSTKNNFEDTAPITSDDNVNNNSPSDLMAISPEPASSPPPLLPTSATLKKNTTRKLYTHRRQLPVASVLQNYFDSRRASATETGNPIHSFFKSMADSVIALPLDLQLKAKNKVYTVVSDIEYENLLRKSTSSTVKGVSNSPKVTDLPTTANLIDTQ